MGSEVDDMVESVKLDAKARNLIEMGLSREDIVKATGLSMEEISKL